jgi:hypothetical protein
MSTRFKVGFLASGYCLAGMAAAAVVLVRMGTLFTHLNLASLIGVILSAVAAWGMGWWLAPGFEKGRTIVVPVLLGTAVAFAALLVSGVTSTVIARIFEGAAYPNGLISGLWTSAWTVFRIMVLFGWMPALALGSVFGLHVRAKLRNASAPTQSNAQ